MKRIPLSDPIFNEVVGAVTRRTIANALLEHRTVFPHPYARWFGKAQEQT
jgi:hypothetical protein